MITFYTNKGKTVDSYSMDVRINGAYDCYSFSENATNADGVNSFLGTIKDPKHEHDYEIDFEELPLQVQKAVFSRLNNEQ